MGCLVCQGDFITHVVSNRERFSERMFRRLAGSSLLCAGSIAKCTVAIGERKMIIDQYNPVMRSGSNMPTRSRSRSPGVSIS